MGGSPEPKDSPASTRFHSQDLDSGAPGARPPGLFRRLLCAHCSRGTRDTGCACSQSPLPPGPEGVPAGLPGGELWPSLGTSVLWAVLGTQSYPNLLFQVQHASLTPNFISSVRPPHQMTRLGHASGNSCTFLGGKGGSDRGIGARGQAT